MYRGFILVRLKKVKQVGRYSDYWTVIPRPAIPKSHVSLVIKPLLGVVRRVSTFHAAASLEKGAASKR